MSGKTLSRDSALISPGHGASIGETSCQSAVAIQRPLKN